MAIRGNTMARYIQPLCHSTGVFQTDGQKVRTDAIAIASSRIAFRNECECAISKKPSCR